MVILDSSTLILIAKVELLDFFLSSVRFEVAVPEEVERECCGAKKTMDGLVIRKALSESRLRVIPVEDEKMVLKLLKDFSLGKGEAEAIALALSQRARLLGVDDKNGINACKVIGLPFTTAIDILVHSCVKGLTSRSGALARLEFLSAHGRYKKSIIDTAKAQLEVIP
jgi:predicted nucleic acid-binding protein